MTSARLNEVHAFSFRIFLVERFSSDPTGMPVVADISDEQELLEYKDSKVLFDNVWNVIEKDVGRENMLFPKEIIWYLFAFP
jgi:hypothetical protein